MEDVKRIKDFLSLGYGDGSGYGSGYGYGSGSGYGDGSGSGSGYGYGYGDGSGSGSGYGSVSGYGSGSGDGSGSGYGDGSGYGYGSGSGIFSYNKETVFSVDGIATLFDRIKGDVAKCRILNRDLTTVPCFVVKQENLFAHGKTLHDAMSALRDKLFEDMPEEERISAFIKEHTLIQGYRASDLYEWHHRLTGSCEFGRKQFAKDHNINLENDWLTVQEFVELTKNAYGGDIIKRLGEAYKKEGDTA